ncbi:VOC family protein [Kangiella sp.]|uniref:VOC family protein n=1 Tax=Kangiella sp. TaxID=1920245 RepID=UPI003A90CDA0
MNVKSICGVIIASKEPKKLAEFYSKALGIVFEKEEHGGLVEHYGADIGKVHFGIHPPENLNKSEEGNATISIAFNVDSLETAITRLKELGATEVIAPHDEGFGMVATYADPAGNHFEIVELDYEFENNQT